jgi:hypothetical protein
MGSRLLEDDDEPKHDPDDPDAPAVLPRKPKSSLLKKMANDVPKASVATSLDDFITKANEGLLDVKENVPSRERELEAKVDELEKKLASAEARAKKAEAQRVAAAEPVMPMAPQSRGFGGIAIAFVLGCGAMFAVSTFVLKKESDKTAGVPAGTQPEADTATTPPPTPAPPPAPEPPANAEQPAPTPAEQTAVAPTPAPTPAPTETKVAAKKQRGTKQSGGTRETKSTPTETQPVKQPESAQNGSAELYNPF